ncbi:MAG: VWA domain-containing protein [Flavobacteriales bacterium]|nr:VWA domain-containing protein [Flavobacteriales bacterium]
MQSKSEKGIGFANSDTENFATAIDEILNNKTLKELCSQDKELAEKVTQEVLDFINKAKREINTSENPFETERELLSSFSETEKKNFEEKWKPTSSFLNENYNKSQIDSNFYNEEFKKTFQKTERKEQRRFESVKEHLTEKWDNLLFAKQTKWELSIIDEWRKKIAEELYKRIEELKKLQQLLEPFTNELGRLFDMSKGNWQRANFDILKRYAEFLKQDKALQQLAEMLGKMRQAEKEFEEEIFSNTAIKPEWKAEYASKADLIGIKESDDLSSLLPAETALLSDETLQSVFIKKFAEKKLQTFEYQAKVLSFKEEEFQDKRQKEKEEAKGPFIICVDTSGSMHGTPETVAKTLCFAILKIAIRENRKCFLISFSTGIETLNLTDLKNSLDKIISFLSMSFHGGTDAAPAMHEALRQLESNDYKKADVLMISDFVMPSFDKQTQAKIISAKENKTKFHSLVIGTSQNQNVIADFDNNWFYNPDRQESILTLVKNLNDL